LDRRRLILASLALLLALIAVYMPLAAVNYYLSTLTEVIYEGSGYRVYYREPLIPMLESSNKTTLIIDVRLDGKPVDFWFMTSGLTVDGAREVAKGAGRGRAAKDISSYIDDAVKVLRKAGADPTFNGLGMLTFITTIIKENGEECIATDIISIPLIPGKARVKEVRVEVDFKPAHKVKVNKTTGQTQEVQQHQATPASASTSYCAPRAMPDKCYHWELKTVHYKSRDREPIPLAIIYVDSVEGSYVKEVFYRQFLIYSPPRLFSVDLALAFQKVANFVVPGPGFIRKAAETYFAFDLLCEITNSKLSLGKLGPDRGHCLYFGRSYESPRVTTTFDGEALIAIGFTGYVWLVEYEYKRWTGEVIDRSLAAYLVPYQLCDELEPVVVIDDDPYDGSGVLEELFRSLQLHSNTTWRRIEGVAGLDSLDIFESSRAEWPFRLAIPLGALAIALSRGSPPGWALATVASLAASFPLQSNVVAMYTDIVAFLSTTLAAFDMWYLELTPYLVREAGNEYYRMPFMVIWPHLNLTATEASSTLPG